METQNPYRPFPSSEYFFSAALPYVRRHLFHQKMSRQFWGSIGRKRWHGTEKTMLNGSDQDPVAQPILAPLTRAAIFLVVTVKPEAESWDTMRSFCGDLPGLIRAVEFRDSLLNGSSAQQLQVQM
jgi:hypothetical protein